MLVVAPQHPAADSKGGKRVAVALKRLDARRINRFQNVDGGLC
jgi:hypothetical protein